MFFHVLGHVEPQEFHTQSVGQLLGDLGFTHTGWASEQVAADGLFRFAQASTGQFDGRGQRLDRCVLTEHDAFEVLVQVFQNRCVVFGYVLWRDAGDFRDDILDFFCADSFAAFAFRDQHLRGTCLVDHVDGFVGQFAVVDVTCCQINGGFDRVVGVANFVVFLEIGFQTHENFDGVRNARLVHVDLLETARQGAVFFEVLTEFLIRCGTHAAQLAALQCGFQDVGGIHRAAGCSTSADNGVNFVDEHDGVIVIFQFFHYGFQTFLEITTITGSRKQCAEVQRIDRSVRQNFGDVFVNNHARQTFGDGGFTNARVANQQRIVLAAAAQDLNATVDFVLAPD